jgi:hypothetical protein
MWLIAMLNPLINMKKNTLIIGSALLLSLAVALPTFAQEDSEFNRGGRGPGRGMRPPEVEGLDDSSVAGLNNRNGGEARGESEDDYGGRGRGQGMMNGGIGQMGLPATVTGISGTTLTVTSSGTVYQVDASAAAIARELTPATVTPGVRPVAEVITFAELKIGDGVAIMGPVSGTSIVATRIVIRPAVTPLGRGMMGRRDDLRQVVAPAASAQARTKASLMSRLWQPFKNFFGWFGWK